MTISHVKKEWDGAILAAGQSPKVFSLHSLRRGGASYSYYNCGAKLADIKRHRGWTSDAVQTYLCPPPGHMGSVQAALQAI